MATVARKINLVAEPKPEVTFTEKELLMADGKPMTVEHAKYCMRLEYERLSKEKVKLTQELAAVDSRLKELRPFSSGGNANNGALEEIIQTMRSRKKFCIDGVMHTRTPSGGSKTRSICY